jgi:hypothetical protein
MCHIPARARQGGPGWTIRRQQASFPRFGPDAAGRVHQPQLSGAAGRQLWSRLPAGPVQMHINLLTDRVWLVPTFKTATSETAARKF